MRLSELRRFLAAHGDFELGQLEMLLAVVCVAGEEYGL